MDADGEFGDPALRMSYASVEEDDYALSELDRLCAAGFHPEIRDVGLVHRVSRLHPCSVQIRACHQRETIWHGAWIDTRRERVVGHTMRKKKPAHHFTGGAGRGVRRTDLGE